MSERVRRALDPRRLLLVTMLHYATRPERTRLIADAGLRAISLDAVTDDLGRRLVEYLEAVAWNGVRLAFVEVASDAPFFAHPSRRPLHVTCLGAGGGRTRGASRDPLRRPRLA